MPINFRKDSSKTVTPSIKDFEESGDGSHRQEKVFEDITLLVQKDSLKEMVPPTKVSKKAEVVPTDEKRLLKKQYHRCKIKKIHRKKHSHRKSDIDKTEENNIDE